MSLWTDFHHSGSIPYDHTQRTPSLPPSLPDFTMKLLPIRYWTDEAVATIDPSYFDCCECDYTANSINELVRRCNMEHRKLEQGLATLDPTQAEVSLDLDWVTGEVCNSVFETRRNLRKHQNNVHKIFNGFCVDCGITYQDEETFLSHQMCSHPDTRATLSWRFFQHSSPNPVLKDQHKGTCLNRPRLSCIVCKSETWQTSHYQHFKEVHSDETFSYDIRDRIYRSQLMLVTHVQKVYNDSQRISLPSLRKGLVHQGRSWITRQGSAYQRTVLKHRYCNCRFRKPPSRYLHELELHQQSLASKCVRCDGYLATDEESSLHEDLLQDDLCRNL